MKLKELLENKVLNEVELSGKERERLSRADAEQALKCLRMADNHLRRLSEVSGGEFDNFRGILTKISVALEDYLYPGE